MKFRVVLSTAAASHEPREIEANSAMEAVAIVAVGIVKLREETGMDIGFRAPLWVAVDEVEDD